MKSTVSIDIFTVPTFRFEILYIFLVLAHDRRRILHFGVTAHPTVQWTARQLREAFPWDSAPKYLLRDRDRIFGADFTKEVEDLGIKEMLSAPRSPWQRAYIERVIGSTGFISLSAGWGLIRTDFLTPCYDIIFNRSAEGYKRRRKAERYQDFRMLPARSDEEIVFFGGKDYVRLFCALTETHAREKTVFYNSVAAPRLGDCRVRKFETASRTNWHYEWRQGVPRWPALSQLETLEIQDYAVHRNEQCKDRNGSIFYRRSHSYKTDQGRISETCE